MASGPPVILVGAGGHAKAVVEALVAQDATPAIYIDPRRAEWLETEVPGLRHVERDDGPDLPADAIFVLAIGGVTPEALMRRRALGEALAARGWHARTTVHPAASVSRSATLAPGATVLAGAVVQPGTDIGAFAIVNTRAVVEHDARVGAGAHVAPGAIVLGQARIGEDAMIGAGAVVLPGADVPPGHLVRALSLHGSGRTTPPGSSR